MQASYSTDRNLYASLIILIAIWRRKRAVLSLLPKVSVRAVTPKSLYKATDASAMHHFEIDDCIKISRLHSPFTTRIRKARETALPCLCHSSAHPALLPRARRLATQLQIRRRLPNGGF